MTFLAEEGATWGTALADLRDLVGGMASWSIDEDSSSGAAQLATGDYFVLTTPAPVEDIRFVVDSTGGVGIEHGKDWNSGTSSWDDRFTYDPSETGQFYGGGSSGNTLDDFGRPVQLYPKNADAGDFPLQMDAPGRYWLEYVDGTGFAFYWQREEGDGNDGDTFVGMAEVNEAWDYTSASNVEAQWVLGIATSFGDNQDLTYLSNSGNTNVTTNDRSAVTAGNTYEGRGLVNPDNAFNNYPLSNHILASHQYRNSDGNEAVIGDHNLWIRDDSGSATGHKDLVQTSGGSNLYTILKRNGIPNVLIRMD